jgi:hypothetical protein
MNPLFSGASATGRRSTREKSGDSVVGGLPGMTGSFEGCKVVVAGGSSGMGKSTAAVREQLASGHADAALPVDAASFFIPRPFLEHDAAFYDPSSYIHPSHLWRKDEHPGRR